MLLIQRQINSISIKLHPCVKKSIFDCSFPGKSYITVTMERPMNLKCIAGVHKSLKINRGLGASLPRDLKLHVESSEPV